MVNTPGGGGNFTTVLPRQRGSARGVSAVCWKRCPTYRQGTRALPCSRRLLAAAAAAASSEHSSSAGPLSSDDNASDNNIPPIPHANSRLTAPANAYVKHLVKLRTNAKYRRECGTYVFVGDRPLKESFARMDVRSVLTSEPELWRDEADACDSLAPVIHTADNVLQKISGVRNADAITAVAEVYMMEHTRFAPGDVVTRMLVLDGVQDPGNVGTLLRTATAFGWTHVFLVRPGSCDLYNEKLLRALRGGHTTISVVEGDAEALRSLLAEHDLEMYAADMNGVDVVEVGRNDANEDARTKGIALALGAEGQGVSIPVYELSKSAVCVPMAVRSMESLNVAVAGGILMYELAVK
ncbi:tRNA/rRNA methyltransferase SpoU type domain-containing protein [Pseudoscourfieldia marina]